MGVMTFQLPAGLTAEAARGLERACIAGGPDNMPWPTEVRVEGNRLLARRAVDESGFLVVPWEVDGIGRLMGGTATLMERPLPYALTVELARGKVNQLRGQAADWKAGGLEIPESLSKQIQDVGLRFGRSVTNAAFEDASRDAQATLRDAYQASEELVRVYSDQVFQIRHQRQPRLDTLFGCRLGRVPQGSAAASLSDAFNAVALALPWSELEPETGNYRWEAVDEVLAWSEANKLAVTAGPLIDFSSVRLPSWLWLYERDIPSLAGFMCAFVETTIRRYRGRVRSWQLTAASNCASLLSLGEDELLWLTVRLAEAARQVDPGLELVVGISQPWGEYMAFEDRTHSPFIFADTLVRSGLNLSALDLEVVAGVAPRGSYCRDSLEMSRLLDLYALLGVPLRVTLGYPAATGNDPNADPEQRLGGGFWHGGFSPAVQAAWTDSFASLAACKPGVQGVLWTHDSDAEAHLFPNCGLLDQSGTPRPALQSLRQLRQKHLK
jgi:hypothetical protein